MAGCRWASTIGTIYLVLPICRYSKILNIAMITFSQFIAEARIQSAIGAVDAHGVVHLKSFPEEGGASHLTHERIFPWSDQSQRFRFDDREISWWAPPTRSDYFTVADYFDKLGFYNVRQYVYFFNDQINPRRLKDV